MPIDNINKFIFIHIPKVAGTSIEKALNIYGNHSEYSFELAFGRYETKKEVFAL